MGVLEDLDDFCKPVSKFWVSTDRIARYDVCASPQVACVNSSRVYRIVVIYSRGPDVRLRLARETSGDQHVPG